jgi:glycosyltransferase involved in cell wall biosynthesis
VALYDALDRWTSILGRRIAVSRPIAARLPWGATLVPNFLGMPPLPPGERPLTVAFVGRLSHEKGPDLFAALSQAAPGPRYEVFGDGPLRADCATAAPGVVFHGARAGMAGAWEGVGLLAITSRAEGLPLAALEAMAHGIPVLAFAVGGLPDLVRSEMEGWLVPPGDVEAMAARVRQWAAMPAAERARMGIAARARVAAEHGRPAGIARMLAAYGLAG